jgi:5-methyltetrahydrofolate--homocysteine methyltransferase
MLLDDANRLRVAIINGDKANAGRIAEACMTMGWSPMDLVDQVMIPALDEVGRGYEEGRLYLPQLMLSAEAAERSFAYLKKNMDPNAVISRGKVIMATVKGDIHDIGKNIVSVLLENYGYSVIDLGKDVPSERIIEAIVREKAQVVGLSALMTTTMIEMKKTMESIQSMGLPVKTIVGGAVITPEYASEIGADAYGADAQDAVRKVAELMAT